MSGGEKARLLLALSTRDAPHLLILDEPTNHLDIDARDALVKALTAFEGAVVLISHDPYLVDLVADRLLLVAGGKVEPFEGDLAAYAASMTERAAGPPRNVAEKKNDKAARLEARAKLAPLRQAAKAAEQALAKLTAEKTILEGKLAGEDIYAPGKAAELTKTTQRLATIKREIDAAELAWLEAHEALEAAG
jgi:ATP-binding cassette subfamily F protein 3